jgi:hypothetical protein
MHNEVSSVACVPAHAHAHHAHFSLSLRHIQPGDEKWVEINAVRDWILDQATKSKQAKL